jgi:hypothetical protein
LIAGTFYDGSYMAFDLAKMEWEKPAVRCGKEEYIWTAAMGGDGRIYGGTYPGGHLAVLDPATMQVEDIPRPAGAEPNLYLRQTSALPDGRILCGWSTQKITAQIYDPKSKAFLPRPAAMEGVQSGVTWNGYFVSGNNWDGKTAAGAQVFQGEDLHAVSTLPFPAPTGKGEWHAETYVSTAETLYLRQGDALYRVRAGEKELTRLTEKGLSGARFLGEGSDGTVLGLRGQDYLTFRPGDREGTLRPIPVETAPRSTHFLRVDPAGRVWGGPTFGQTVFYMDKAGKVTNTSQVSNSGGEVYDAAFVDGKTYLVAYVGGDVIEFDPARPWDQRGGTNPRILTKLTERGYIRPVAGVAVGPDKKLYSGWLAAYGKYGGAVSITDVKSGKTELIENPFGEVGISGVAFDGQMIYAGSTREANGLPKKPDAQVTFGVIDPGTKEVTFKKEFEGAAVNHLVWEPKSKRVAMTVDGKWYVFEPSRLDLHEVNAPKAESHMVPGVYDGRVYYGSGTEVLALDPVKGRAEILATAPAKVDTVAVGTDGAVYFSCGVAVYRVVP